MNGFIEISEGLYYEEETGMPWSNKINNFRRLKAKNQKSYFIVRINGENKRWHRLVYEHFNGPIPKGLQVDHINNNRDDNRISNLQLLSNKENARYRKKQCNNKSGLTGAHWKKSHNKWLSSIGINGKSKFLGLFESPEEAHQAFLDAKIKYHGKESIRAL